MLMSMNEVLSKKQRTNLKLIEEANRQFSLNGYEATGVDSIVEALGLTSGVFYSHFKSKQELLIKIIEYKTEKSKNLFFTPVPKESAFDWIQRMLELYLSVEHKDNIHLSCPLTTMSQELIKLNLHTKTGLSAYLDEFASVLNRRLLMVSSLNQGKAEVILSICVGAVILSRTKQNESEARQILIQAREAAIKLIVTRNHH
jgi:TetR/AcrR family transcriptional repressor of nem operon